MKRSACDWQRTVLLASLLWAGACLERGGDKKTPEPPPAAVPSEDLAPSADLTPAVRDQEPGGRAQEDATIAVHLPAEPLHLNPMLAGDTVAVSVAMGDVFEGLLAIDKPGQTPRAGLAKTYVRSADGQRWTFYLRSGVRFHDGKRMTVADVLRSYELARKAPGPLAAELDDLERVSSQGDDAVVFRFAESRPSRAEAFAAIPILPARSLRGVEPTSLRRARVSRQPNGTGPLRFVSWKDGVITLERFAAYWGPPARARTIEHRVIPDRQRVIAELRSGALHAALRLPVDEALRAARDIPSLTVVRESLPAYTAAVFNTQKGALGVDARRALSKTFDRAAIVEQLFQGHGEIAIGPYVAGSERDDPEATAPAFSLPEAREELAAAWDKPVSSLAVLVPAGSRTMKRLADIWAADLRDLVTIEVVALPFADMLTRVRAGDFDVCMLSFTTSSEVDLYSLFHSTQVGGGNLSRLSDPAVDVLLDGVRRAQSREDRRNRSRELHRLLLYLAPFAFLTTDVRLGLVQRDVAGVGDTAAVWGGRNLWRRE